jgi:hypothetical protein
MKRIILTAVCISTMVIAKAQEINSKIWTKDYEKQVYEICYKSVSPLVKREDQKQLLADCQLKKIMKLLPSGLGQDVNNKVKHIIYQTGFDCAIEHHNIETNSWTPEVIKFVRSGFLQNPQLNELNQAQKEVFCDCYLQELINRYPSGVKNGVDPNIQQEIAKKCVKSMSK